MDKNKIGLELVKNAVVALEAQKGFYVAKNFDRDMCILHKSKLNLIPAYLLEDMTDAELRKLLTDIIDKSYSETQEYIRNYKRSKGEPPRRHEAQEDEDVIHATQRIKNESGRVQYITIDIKPRIKVDGQRLQFGFSNKTESEIYTLAYRRSQARIHSIISSEISKMLQEPEFEPYAKKLLKK